MEPQHQKYVAMSLKTIDRVFGDDMSELCEDSDVDVRGIFSGVFNSLVSCGQISDIRTRTKLQEQWCEFREIIMQHCSNEQIWNHSYIGLWTFLNSHACPQAGWCGSPHEGFECTLSLCYDRQKGKDLFWANSVNTSTEFLEVIVLLNWLCDILNIDKNKLAHKIPVIIDMKPFIAMEFDCGCFYCCGSQESVEYPDDPTPLEEAYPPCDDLDVEGIKFAATVDHELRRKFLMKKHASMLRAKHNKRLLKKMAISNTKKQNAKGRNTSRTHRRKIAIGE